MNIYRCSVGLASIAAGLLAAGNASAQPVRAQGAQAAPQGDDTSGVADIIVTAQKRSENLSRVGLTISAIGGDALRAQGVSNVTDLAKVTPGLTYANSTNNTPVYTLRGVGFYETSLAAYPAVSVYVDEVALPLPVLAAQVGLDPERVEVLKGPQGTLFGQNATGGAINFIAAKPTDELTGGVSASYGRFNAFTADGFVSGPLSSTVKARLSAKVAEGGAWQKSYTADDRLGKARTFAARLLLDWDPTTDIRFRLNVNGSIDKSDPQAAQFIELFPQNVVIFPELANYPKAPANSRAADWGTGIDRPRGDDRQWQISLRGEWDLSPDVTLTSLTSYIHFTRDQTNDPDGMRIQEFTFDVLGKISSFSQELRLSGKSERLRWIVGGNIETTKVDDLDILRVAYSTSASTLGLRGNNFYSNQKMLNAAGFANADFDITDRFTVKAGLRFTQSNRKNESCTIDNGDGRVSALFTAIASGLRGAPIAPIPPGACVNLGSDNLPGVYRAELNENNLSWRVGADYRPSSTSLLYLNVAKGYKAGSFPTATAATNVQFQPVVQESVLDVEGGFKVQLLNRKVSVNGAAFFYSYDNKQLRSKLIDPVFGVLDALVNIPKSTVRGGEISVIAAPSKGLTFSASATYLDAYIQRYAGINGIGQPANFAGEPMPFAPKWQFAGAADYNFPLVEGLNAFVGGNLTYNSSTYSIVGRDPSAVISDFTLIDLRAGLETADKKYRLSIWGKNITNQYYWTNAAAVNDAKVRFAGRPATYGVTVGARF